MATPIMIWQYAASRGQSIGRAPAGAGVDPAAASWPVALVGVACAGAVVTGTGAGRSAGSRSVLTTTETDTATARIRATTGKAPVPGPAPTPAPAAGAASSTHTMAEHDSTWAPCCPPGAGGPVVARARHLPRTACPANQAVPAANSTVQARAWSGLSRGTSIPAMATPITVCITSAPWSVERRHQRAAASRVAQYPAITSRIAASTAASQDGGATSPHPRQRAWLRGTPGAPQIHGLAGFRRATL